MRSTAEFFNAIRPYQTLSPASVGPESRRSLEQGIKAMRGKTLVMPDRPVDGPDRDRLAAWFEYYRLSN